MQFLHKIWIREPDYLGNFKVHIYVKLWKVGAITSEGQISVSEGHKLWQQLSIIKIQ